MLPVCCNYQPVTNTGTEYCGTKRFRRQGKQREVGRVVSTASASEVTQDWATPSPKGTQIPKVSSKMGWGTSVNGYQHAVRIWRNYSLQSLNEQTCDRI
jgi:hypothetical protein